MPKRKRSVSSTNIHKRTKLGPPDDRNSAHRRDKPYQLLLKHVYQDVKTLKEYLLDTLPPTSRLRRKRLLSFTQENLENEDFLNSTLVGRFQHQPSSTLIAREQEFAQFSQTRRAACQPSATTQQCTLDEASQRNTIYTTLI